MIPQNPQQNKPIVFLDTNIFGYLVDLDRIDGMIRIFGEVGKGYDISISEYTYYEVLRKGTKEIHILDKAFDVFKKFVVDGDVLRFAALFFCLGLKKNGDSIIASTAFLNKAFILTSDQRDFKEPYFNEVKCWPLVSIKEKRTNTINVFLLKLDISQILQNFGKIPYLEELTKDKQLEKGKPEVTGEPA